MCYTCKKRYERGAKMHQFVSNSVKETEDFAYEFAKTLKAGDVVAFEGNLGA